MTATTVVLAGGRGTRVESLTGGRAPKAMLDVGGRPFIDRKLDELAAQGVRDVVVLAGHGGPGLRQHLAAHPHPLLQVRVHEDGPRLLGTGGAVARVLDELPETFWLTYGDTLLEVDMEPLEALLPNDAEGLLTVVHNRDDLQPSNTTLEGGLVTAYSKGDPPGAHEHLDYGLLLVRARAFAGFVPGTTFDLGEVLRAMIERRRLAGVEVDAAFHDIGTPDAWRATSQRYRGC